VELDPNNVEGWTQLGHLLYRIGQFDHAADAYRKILIRGEETNDWGILATAYTNLGIMYRIQGALD
jgi:cytochrome c-type biogenesis protein CcmH/NrfG